MGGGGGGGWAALANEAMQNYLALGRLIYNSGVEENLEKASPPATEMIFLGILFDTIAMTLSIPQEKQQEIYELLKNWEDKTSMTRNE